MKALRRQSHWSIVPAALWLVAQLIMSTGLVALGPSGTATASGNDVMVICTPQGMKTVPAPWLDVEPSQAGSEADSTTHACSWCQLLGSVVPPSPPARVSVVDGAAAATLIAWPTEEPASTFPRAAEGIDSRAPPLSDAFS